MVALKIEDIRLFTEKLFLKEDFDHFLVREISIVTFNRFEMTAISGEIITQRKREDGWKARNCLPGGC